MNMFRFQNIEYLWLLAIPGLIILLFIISSFFSKKKLNKIGDINLIKLLIPDASQSRKILKLILVCLSLSSMVIAIARPQFGTQLKEVKTQGIEVIVALDVSYSMLAQDLKPDRLSNAKRFIEKILGRLKNDKFGMIIFAGDAIVQMPITDDVNSARLYLSTINTDIIPVQGTEIGKALDLSARSFTKDEKASKVIILITDGENHETDDILDISNKLKEKDIKVFTVGMGLEEGAPIPNVNGRGFLKDKNGNVVISALDEKTLINIANSTKGIYVRATNASNTTDVILDEISKLNTSEIIKREFSKFDDKFQYFAFLAFILLIIDVFTSERKNKLFKNINIFMNNRYILLTIIFCILNIATFAQEERKLNREGIKNYQQKEYQQAEEIFKQAFEKKPEQSQIQNNIGASQYKNNDFGTAATTYNDILNSSINNNQKADAYYNIGNSYLQAGKYEKSIEAYKNAIKIDPNHEPSKYNMSIAKNILAKQIQQQNENQDNNDKNEDNQNCNNQQNQDGDNQQQENQNLKDKSDKDIQKQVEEELKKIMEENEKKSKEQENSQKEEDTQKQQEQSEEEKNDEEPQPQQQQIESQNDDTKQMSESEMKIFLEWLQEQEKQIQEKLQKEKAKSSKRKVEKEW